MDWGGNLTEDEKFKSGDIKNPRPEALIRLGVVGPDQIAEDDDVIIVIAPQNGKKSNYFFFFSFSYLFLYSNLHQLAFDHSTSLHSILFYSLTEVISI